MSEAVKTPTPEPAAEALAPAGDAKAPVPATPPAEAAVAPPAPAEPAAVEEKPAKPAPSPEPQGKIAEDWREARLRVETAKRREAESKARELQAKLDAQKPLEPMPQTVINEADIERRVSERAAQQAQWDAFNSACNAAATAGKAAYADFDTRVNELRKLADVNDPVSLAAYNGFLAAALETGEAPKLIHALGGDLNEAQRIMNLPPLKMAVELTKLASKPETQISKAPKPIAALAPHGGSRDAINPGDKERADGLSTKAWIERREAQIRAKEARQ